MAKPLSSVSRAIDIMEFLAAADAAGASLATISTAVGANKATVHASLATLRDRDWVAQDSVTGNYRLGRAIDVFTRTETTDERLKRELRPALESISREFNELVHLGRLDGPSMYYVEKVEPNRSIRVVSKIGLHVPAVRTAIGRAILAASAEREFLVEQAMASSDISELDESLVQSLRDSVADNFRRYDTEGWVQEIGENEEGIACVGVPVFRDGHPVAAVSVTTPIERLPARVRPGIAKFVREAVAES